MKIAPRCVHFHDLRDPYGATAPPIYQTATFHQPSAIEFGEYDYTRSANPPRSLLEEQLAALEEGSFAFAFASGMAAIAAVTRLVEAGGEILGGEHLYGGASRLFSQVSSRQGIGVRYADLTDLDTVQRAMTPDTRLVMAETPTIPLLRIVDIAGLAEVAHRRGAVLAVDNSLLSPCLQRPLRLGADLVIHSATKFLCGHSDLSAGAVVGGDPELGRLLAFHQNAEGAGLAPFDSWLLLRSVKTLALRVERQTASARRIAEFLAGHPHVEKVFFPALPDHPGREVHERQASGPGAGMSFTTGDPRLSRHVVEATKLFSIAVSFGSVGSVISLPCRMSHASIPPELRGRLSPPADLVRLSVGIEDADDLIEDLAAAFPAARAGCRVGGPRDFLTSP